jgi:fructokinase
MKVLSFGEILWDIINGEEHLGGAPFNFAAHSAQCGNEVYMISCLGRDSLGTRAFEKCKEHGVDCQFVQWDETHPTGTVMVTLEKGQPDYVIHENVAWDFIATETNLSALPKDSFDIFYFGSLVQRTKVAAETLHAILNTFSFKHIFYDVNLRKKGFTIDIIKQSLERCTILKLNTDEVPVISRLLFQSDLFNEDFCQEIIARYPRIKTIVITASDKGCFVFQNNKLTHIAGKKVQVKDAVGAGDSFSAAFMHIFTRENDALKAAEIANEIGAFVATQAGALPVYPAEIKSLLNPLHV